MNKNITSKNYVEKLKSLKNRGFNVSSKHAPEKLGVYYKINSELYTTSDVSTCIGKITKIEHNGSHYKRPSIILYFHIYRIL